MPTPPTPTPPAQPDVLLPPWTWQAAVGRETARLVGRYRPEAPDEEVRCRVLGVAWEVIGWCSALPPREVALGALADPQYRRGRNVELYRLILACHPVDWSDGRTRLEFLAEVVRALDVALGAGPGRETPTAHPGVRRDPPHES